MEAEQLRLFEGYDPPSAPAAKWVLRVQGDTVLGDEEVRLLLGGDSDSKTLFQTLESLGREAVLQMYCLDSLTVTLRRSAPRSKGRKMFDALD